MKLKLCLSLVFIWCFFIGFDTFIREAKAVTKGNQATLDLHFIDVNQADAIYIKTPGGKQILIDSGSDLTVDKVIPYLKEQGVKTLNMVILTHPHRDHIGGMLAILNTFNVEVFYMPEQPTFDTNKFYITALHKALFDKGIVVFHQTAGETLELGKDLVLKFIGPIPGNYESLNEYSSVIKINYKKNKILLMADAGEQSEAELLHSGFDLKADLIKISHHGGRTGNTLAFLRAVHPKAAIISTAGRKNFPSEDVINRLRYLTIPTYRTDQFGTVVVHSDGEHMRFSFKYDHQKKVEMPYDPLDFLFSP